MAGTGFIVYWDTVRDYGKTVAQQENAFVQVNSVLGGARLPSNAFGMLPEARDLHDAYTQHADECLQITGQLPVQITKVADSLYNAAGAYSDTETGLVDLIDNLGLEGEDGGGAAGDSARESAFFASLVQETTAAYAWTKKSCTALPAAQAPQSGDKGLDGMLDEAINWVMDHTGLMKVLDDVTGDTGALIRAANLWAEQGNRVNAIIGALREGAADLPQQYAGEAATALGTFMGDVTEGLTQLVTVMGQTAKILEQAASEAAMAHDLIVDIIRDVVEWVATNILIDAATLGLGAALDAVDAEIFLAKEAEEAEKVSATLAKVLKELERIVHEMVKFKDDFKEAEGLGKLAKFASTSGKLYRKTLADGSPLNMGAAIKDGRKVRAYVDLAVREGLHHGMGPQGVGALGGLIHAGTTIAKDVLEKPVKDLVSGAVPPDGSHDPSQIAQNVMNTGVPKVEGDLRQDGRQLGIEPTPTPQAPPTSRIESLLNGQNPDPASGQSSGSSHD